MFNIRRNVIRMAVAAVLCLAATPAAADVLGNQVFDWANGLRSDRNTNIPLAYTADDVHFKDPVIVDSFMATFIVDRRVAMADWELAIFSNVGGKPHEVLAIYPAGVAVNTNQVWDARVPDLRIFEITWDLEQLMILPGRYWLIARAVGTGDNSQRAYWGTARTAQNSRWRDAHFIAPFAGITQWTPWSQMDPSYMLDTDPEFDGADFDCAWKMVGEVAERADLRHAEVLVGSDGLVDLFRVLSLDEIYFSSGSTSDNNPSTVNMMIAKFIAVSELQDPQSLQVDVHSQNNINGGRLVMFLWNWQTREREWVGAGRIDSHVQRFRATNLDPAKYIHPDNGRIVLLVKVYVDDRPDNSPFVNWIDYVEFRVE